MFEDGATTGPPWELLGRDLLPLPTKDAILARCSAGSWTLSSLSISVFSIFKAFFLSRNL